MYLPEFSPFEEPDVPGGEIPESDADVTLPAGASERDSGEALQEEPTVEEGVA